MTDLGPSKERLAKLFRMLGSSDGERRAAFAALERTMKSEGVSWSDIGNAIEHDSGESKYTEAEMLEYGQAARAEGVKAGIEIGLARASDSGGNGHLTLPPPAEMADFVRDRRGQLKDDGQRQFIDEMVVKTQRLRNRLAPGTLGYLVSLYIKHGGKI
jgi:hypothetical protein